MKYIHIKNLEKYHPGYKDRTLQWAKIYFTMVQGDPDCEMIENEIDWGRLIKFILLELEAKKPIPINNTYLAKKGINLKKRPIELTLKMLHNFIVVVTEDLKVCVLDKDKELDKEKEKEYKKDCVTVLDYFNSKSGKSYTLTTERERIIHINFNKKRTVEQLKQAIDNFVIDDWPDRHQYMDLVYCIGVRNSIDNFDKWYNSKPKTKFETEPLPTDEELKKWQEENK